MSIFGFKKVLNSKGKSSQLNQLGKSSREASEEEEAVVIMTEEAIEADAPIPVHTLGPGLHQGIFD